MIRWILGALLLLLLGFTEELYRYVFCRGSSKLFEKLFDSKGHEQGYYEFRDRGTRKLREYPHKTYTIRSDRGEALKGFYYDCGGEGKKIAFIAHGYRSDHADTGALCFDYYESRHIDVFACDHTASGESGGHFIGFDVLESRDCLKWVDFLVETFGPETRILLHGFSMGAATVMKMSSACPENVKFIVEDSGYQNAEAAMRHQVGPFYGPLRLINRLVAGYDWKDSDVRESLKHSSVPMLFVHGQEDKLVPYCNGPALYDLYPGEKDCLFPENTKHVETMYTSFDRYAEKLDSFLNAYMQ